MNDKDIIQLALEHFGAVLKPSDLEVQLAVLAVAIEREACAKVAESFDPSMQWSNHGVHIANMIRARVT